MSRQGTAPVALSGSARMESEKGHRNFAPAALSKDIEDDKDCKDIKDKIPVLVVLLVL